MATDGKKALHEFNNTSYFYRASARNACRARYCITNSVRLSLCPPNAGIVSKRMDKSHIFDILAGASF